jgi:copper(I)-binding protein
VRSSNRGSGSHTAETTVENAFIVPNFVPGSCAIQVGDAARLRFTATNNRSTESERLSGITTAAAESVRITPSAPVVIPPRSSVAAGQPIEHPGGQAAPDEPFTVTVQGLTESARPGTSVDVTFRFEKYGDLEMRVPIEACPTQKQ